MHYKIYEVNVGFALPCFLFDYHKIAVAHMICVEREFINFICNWRKVEIGVLKVDLRKKEDDRPFYFNSRGFKCVFWFCISSYGLLELSG